MAVQRIGIGLDNRKPYNRNVFVLKSPLGAKYVEQAILQGGAGGSSVCVAKTFEKTDEIPTPGLELSRVYSDLAIAAGGTGGSSFCAERTFKITETIPTDGWNLAATYRTLAETDGGTGGNAYCAQKTFSNFT